MTIQEIKAKIPHGGYREISKRAKVNVITTSNFFNKKKKVSPKTETKILTATAEYLQELKRKRVKVEEILEKI